MKKKITIICCIMIIIFNFIFGSLNVVFADEEKAEQTTTAVQSDESNKNPLNMGEDINSGAKDIFSNLRKNTVQYAIGGISAGSSATVKTVNLLQKQQGETMSAIMTWLVRILTFSTAWANNIPQLAVEATNNDLNLDYFTVYSLVMGEYEFFNANFFAKEDETESAGFVDALTGAVIGDGNVFQDLTDVIKGKAKTLSLSGKIKQNIRTFYYILRTLSIAASLFVLIYIGIRMAISTIQGEDKAKYVNMFTNWAASFVLLMFMHFIIIAICYLTTEALGLLRGLATALGISNIELEIFQGRGEIGSFYKGNILINPVGFHLLNSMITIAIFVYYQLKFFITYTRRFCEIAFLIVVSPLVTITYSIDKVADNKAQAFNTWIKELSVKYAIQVVHALTYCIFIASAGAIAEEVPLLGALFLLCLDKAEKIFRNVLRVNYDGFQRVKVPFFGGK